MSDTIFLVALPGAVAAAPTIGGCPVFPANNIWNTRVDNLPVHPKSAAYITSIGANGNLFMDFGSGVYPDFPDPDAAPIGIPFVGVPGSQPKVPVTFTDYGDESDSAPNVPVTPVGGVYRANYPIPPNAPIEGVGNPLNNGDRHVLVIDTTNCILYETGNSFPRNNGTSWDASGGAIYDLKVNGPLRPAGWTSADAAGLPIFPGLVRYDEANSVDGIQHALRFTAAQTQRAYVWPATHFASASTDTNRPPMGMRFRLKASKDISGFNPRAKAIAQAMKTYGIILADNGSNWFVSGAPDERWINSERNHVNSLKGSDFEAVDVSSLMVSPTSGEAKAPASTTTLASSVNPSSSGQNVTFTATVSGASGTPEGTVAFTNAGATLAGCGAVALASGVATCSTAALAAGSRPITATYTSSGAYAGSASVALSQVVTSGAALLTANPATLTFGGQSLNTTSPSQSTTLTNNSGAAVTITAITAPQGFTATHSCTTINNGASCPVSLTFTPNAQGSMNNLLAVAYAGGGPTTVALTGTGERSLVTHYYRSILRRAPDAGGKTYWDGEATRVANLGANVNEVWFAMAMQFYFSAEYAAFNRNNTDYVTDLYNTFFNRAPDGAGLGFWVNNLGSGMPREVALAEFMFSTEFRNFAQAIFGNTAARAEVNMAIDFYRGLLARTPDDSGFNFWVGRFRAAQCSGSGAITNEVEGISSAFALSTEYTTRGRTNAQHVGDLYNAFLRRGGDLAGVQFWIGQLNSGAQTREQLRVQFKNSTEFQARVQAVIQQGCL